jgi:hypothetical protein
MPETPINRIESSFGEAAGKRFRKSLMNIGVLSTIPAIRVLTCVLTL